MTEGVAGPDPLQLALKMGGPRSRLLIRQAYDEEGLPCPAIDERISPIILLYPRSFVERIARMSREKIHDYVFIGGLYRPDTFANRRWILDFARRRFTDRSYLLITDGRGRHDSLGVFDRTGSEDDVFVPKQMPPPARGFFHEHYFRVMSASACTLCPAGDGPWSMRFFEAVMCRSIPVVSERAHAGRNYLERGIGYGTYLAGEPHAFEEKTAQRNFELFLRHQTLMAR